MYGPGPTSSRLGLPATTHVADTRLPAASIPTHPRRRTTKIVRPQTLPLRFPSNPHPTVVAHPWPALRRRTLPAPALEGTVPPEAMEDLTADANAQMPLIPCPFCGSRISTAVSRKGTRPGTRYYKCRFFSVSPRSKSVYFVICIFLMPFWILIFLLLPCSLESGQCPFFEWREEYADRVGGNPALLQNAGIQVAAQQPGPGD
jgi:hypothetical protein